VHIKILKLTGIVTLVSMVAVTLAITTNLYILEHRRNGTDLTIQSPFTVNNSSLCHFIKQFALPDHYFVTVCLYQNEILVCFIITISNSWRLIFLYVNVVKVSLKNQIVSL
jgi:hypothetical protein